MKQKKFTIFLVAVALFLTVYYLKLPHKTSNDTPVIQTPTATKIDELKANHLIETNTLFEGYIHVLSSADSTFMEKEDALLQKEKLFEQCETEAILENSIESLGFLDSYVELENKAGISYCYVTVFSPSLLETQVLEIMLQTKKSFETPIYVSVSYVKE